MGDAAVADLSRPPADVNGKCFIDSAVLAEACVTDLAAAAAATIPSLISRRQAASISLPLEMAASSNPDAPRWCPADPPDHN
jgi:hypothetical protein